MYAYLFGYFFVRWIFCTYNSKQQNNGRFIDLQLKISLVDGVGESILPIFLELIKQVFYLKISLLFSVPLNKMASYVTSQHLEMLSKFFLLIQMCAMKFPKSQSSKYFPSLILYTMFVFVNCTLFWTRPYLNCSWYCTSSLGLIMNAVLKLPDNADKPYTLYIIFIHNVNIPDFLIYLFSLILGYCC